jgi:hypothetical protein
VKYVYEKSPFYRLRLDRAGVPPGEVERLEDLASRPDRNAWGVLICPPVFPPWAPF